VVLPTLSGTMTLLSALSGLDALPSKSFMNDFEGENCI
jgi:hypothetical protein